MSLRANHCGASIPANHFIFNHSVPQRSLSCHAVRQTKKSKPFPRMRVPIPFVEMDFKSNLFRTRTFVLVGQVKNPNIEIWNYIPSIYHSLKLCDFLLLHPSPSGLHWKNRRNTCFKIVLKTNTIVQKNQPHQIGGIMTLFATQTKPFYNKTNFTKRVASQAPWTCSSRPGSNEISPSPSSNNLKSANKSWVDHVRRRRNIV